MGATPTVSVVIPTRNRLAMLRQAIASALAQEDVDLEVIVVDEGSADGTANWLAALADPRVRTIRHDEPRRLPGARNAGIAAARGEYVAFLDDDDLWARAKLRTQLRAMRNAGAGWSFVGAVHVNGALEPVAVHRAPHGDAVREALLDGNAVPGGGSGVVVERELIARAGGFDETLNASEDWECWIRLAALATAAGIDEPLLGRRMHPGSMSHSIDRMLEADRRVGELHPHLVSSSARADRPVADMRYGVRLAREAGDWRGAARLLWLERHHRGTLLRGPLYLVTPPRVWDWMFRVRRADWRWARPLADELAALHGEPRRARRPAFVTWAIDDGRAREISAAIGGRPVRVHPVSGHGALAKALRYLVSGPLTLLLLVRARPSVVIAASPPVFSAGFAALYARLVRVPFLLDAHPPTFGRGGTFVTRRLLGVARRLTRSARATLVASDELAVTVRAWGGRPLVLHEAPPGWTVDEPPPAHGTPVVLLINVFLHDERPELAVAAAGDLPARLRITGDRALAPPGLIDRAPANVEFTGYLRGSDFVDAIREATLILVLTDEATSVPRSGYEAVRAGRQLIVSASDATRRAFPGATHVENTSEAIRAAIAAALAAPRAADELAADRVALEHVWAEQHAALLRVLG